MLRHLNTSSSKELKAGNWGWNWWRSHRKVILPGSFLMAHSASFLIASSGVAPPAVSWALQHQSLNKIMLSQAIHWKENLLNWSSLLKIDSSLYQVWCQTSQHTQYAWGKLSIYSEVQELTDWQALIRSISYLTTHLHPHRRMSNRKHFSSLLSLSWLRNNAQKQHKYVWTSSLLQVFRQDHLIEFSQWLYFRD